MGDGQEAGGVTRDEAIKFLETACRNWQHVGPLRDDDLSDVADALSRFVKARATPSSNEAVAWLYSCERYQSFVVTDHTDARAQWARSMPRWTETPLYAHPPAASSGVASDDEVEAVARALNLQMEAQADDLTPSSVQREKGLFWLEGWFDLKAAIAALKAKP